MRRLSIALTLLIGARVNAEVVPEPMAPPADPDRGNFWRDMVEPHKDEVAMIVAKARNAIQQADNALVADTDPTGTNRAKIYREVNGMLRYARRLAPDNLDVLELYGTTADALGRTRQAIDAFHAAIDMVGAEKAGIEITGRLGEIYLRLGQLDDAIHYLRVAQGPIVPGKPTTAHVLVHLASALAQRGLTSDAIDVLASALPQNPPYYSNEMQVVAFALAVMYDRDEQRSAALETLDHLRAALQDQMGPMLQNALAPLRYAPADDEAYFLGLLYEAVGNFPEARAEWALYASSGDQPFRARALDHVAAIDANPHPVEDPASTMQIKLVPHRHRHMLPPPPPPPPTP